MDLRYETPRTLRHRLAEVNWALRNRGVKASASLRDQHDQIVAALNGECHPGNVGFDEYQERYNPNPKGE